MRARWNAVHIVQDTANKPAVPRYNPAHLPRPSTLPRRPLPPNVFKPPIGQKQIHLPNFTVALVRPSPHLPPNYASFLTPLWFNKLDLKDYLYHLYGLEAVSVRSYIIQSRVREKKFQGSRKWYRPASTKKMTAELVKDGDPALAAFEWPKETEDIEDVFGKRREDKRHELTRNEKRREMERQVRESDNESEQPPEDLEDVRKKARKLRKEREKEEEEKRGKAGEMEVKMEKNRVRKAKLLELG